MTVLTFKYPKALKTHKCQVCGCDIPKGSCITIKLAFMMGRFSLGVLTPIALKWTGITIGVAWRMTKQTIISVGIAVDGPTQSIA